MNDRRTHRLTITALMCSAIWISTPAQAIDANWTAGTGDYSNVGNWDVPALPCNEVLASVDVTIPDGARTVTQDVALCSADSLAVGASVVFSLPPNTSYPSMSAEIAGLVSGVGGDFSADTATFIGAAPGAHAAQGSAITIGAPTYSSVGAPNSSLILFSATDTDSLLDLSTLASIDAGFNSGVSTSQIHSVVASTAGVVDLGGLVTATGPVDDEDTLDFIVSGTARIDLASLSTVSAGGQVRFLASDGATQELPSLSSVTGGIFTTNGSAAIVTEGSSWTYSSIGLPNGNYTLMSASDPGSVLGLSGLTSFNGSFNSGVGTAQTHSVQASSGGLVDLSSMTNVSGPIDDEDRLDFSVSDTAQIDLSSLSTAIGNGQIRFIATAGASLDMPALTAITEGIFAASGAATISAEGSAWTYSSAGLPNSTITLMSAADPGAVLALSGLTAFSSSFNSGVTTTQTHSVTASNGGIVDLSSMVSIAGPFDDEDRLDFNVTDTGQIDLSSLSTVTGGAQVRFIADSAASLSMPALSAVTEGIFLASGGSTMSADSSAWTYSSAGLPNSTITLMSAEEGGTVLALSGLTAFDASFNSGVSTTQTHSVEASNGGTVDLSSMASVAGPFDDEDRLDFEVTDTGHIDLSSLGVVNGGAQVRFIASDGALLELPALESVSEGIFVASAGGTVSANGGDWTYSSVGFPNSALTIMSATGAGSTLDLSSANSLNANFNSGTSGAQVHTVSASDGGIVDLSGIGTISAPFDPEDRLDFVIEDATLLIGPMNDTAGNGGIYMTLADSAAHVIAPRSFGPTADIRLIAAAGSLLSVIGDYSFRHVIETDLLLEGASIEILDDGEDITEQTLEVGGFDIGTVLPVSENFEFGQLVVGAGTDVRLFDAVDNGNIHNLCIDNREALYLLGLDAGVAGDGLVIENGSTLNLNDINLYTVIGQVLTHVNPMVTPGVPLPFGDGFIEAGDANDMDSDGVEDNLDNCVIEPNPDQRDTNSDGYGNICDADLDNDGNINFVDVGIMKEAFFSSPGAANWNPDADLDGDDAINFIDLGILKRVVFGEPGPSCAVAL